MIMVLSDPRRHERYEREVAKTQETAEKIRRDAGESLEAHVIDQEAHDRLYAMATEYADSTIKLLRVVYLGHDS